MNPRARLLSIAVAAVLASAGPSAFAGELNGFRLQDDQTLDLGPIRAKGEVKVYNAGRSGMVVRVWNARSGQWEQHNVPPGQVWRGEYAARSIVQILDVPDHVDGKGGYALPKR